MAEQEREDRSKAFDKLTGTYEHPAAIKVLRPFSARQTVDID